MTVPDLPTVEAYHAAVTAAIDTEHGARTYGAAGHALFARDRTLVDRAVARLRRHNRDHFNPDDCFCCNQQLWPCPDALDAWADLTDIGATYGVTCPTCTGPIRETVGMVCQTCGTDYGKRS